MPGRRLYTQSLINRPRGSLAARIAAAVLLCAWRSPPAACEPAPTTMETALLDLHRGRQSAALVEFL
ncbi:MAG: hypothetical protein ACHQ2Z_05915, partial [Elusimicrobiota bacterium]